MGDTTAVDLAFRDRLRDYIPLMTLLSNDIRRVDIDDANVSKSYVTVFRAGGAPAARVNVDDALLTFDCWAPTWAAANKLARAVSDCVRTTHHAYYGDTLIDRCQVLSMYDSPPDEPNTHRFVVTALIHAKRAATT